MKTFHVILFAILGSCLLWEKAAADDSLLPGWNDPPKDSRLRAYWWWLNGNVTAEAITHDLEEMKAKGFGGALICDAGGASQDGNSEVPPGPVFLSEPWMELYRHALREAARLDLEMSLNIQSGWNLGGPSVKADDAAKKLVWTEMEASAASKGPLRPAAPASRDGYYRDLFVVAYPRKSDDSVRASISASSSQDENHAALMAGDGDPESFWVSNGTRPQRGGIRNEWLEVRFEDSFPAEKLTIAGREGYGPSACDILVSSDGVKFAKVDGRSGIPADKVVEFPLSGKPIKAVRMVVLGAHDPVHPQSPRNVQVAGIRIDGGGKSWPASGAGNARPIRNWREKAMQRTLHFSAPDTTPLLTDVEAVPGEEHAALETVVDLTDKLAADGTLNWRPPSGTWQVIRFGCTIGDHAQVSTSSPGWKGYAIDVLDQGAFERYWKAVVDPLIREAGVHAGKTLAYLHTDSWEVEAVNWTPTLRSEFQKRRGYDMIPWLPVLTGKIIGSRDRSNRFLHDYRKTLGDLAVDHHYKPFVAMAEKHGLKIHPESGGPHASPIDAQKCLGINHVPMSEFWTWSWKHRVGDINRFFVKQPASAAHVNARKLVAAEGFTTIGPHWQETLWDNLKPAFDHACTEGLNLLVWHAFVCSPKEMGIPGQQYFAGTHLNPNVTWWEKSSPFFKYINRCQWMLQQGKFVADACYYYGDHVPNFAQHRGSDPAKVGKGRDYDVVTEDVILNRMQCRDGMLVLPDGMSYRTLVLRDHSSISLPVLRKLRELSLAGARILGPKPTAATGLTGYPDCDAEVAKIAAELWDGGKITDVDSADDDLTKSGIVRDFEWTGDAMPDSIGYIHRQTDDAEIFFINNREPIAVSLACRFRASGKGVYGMR